MVVVVVQYYFILCSDVFVQLRFAVAFDKKDERNLLKVFFEISTI